jgi:hypothetical protein
MFFSSLAVVGTVTEEKNGRRYGGGSPPRLPIVSAARS